LPPQMGDRGAMNARQNAAVAELLFFPLRREPAAQNEPFPLQLRKRAADVARVESKDARECGWCDRTADLDPTSHDAADINGFCALGRNPVHPIIRYPAQGAAVFDERLKPLFCRSREAGLLRLREEDQAQEGVVKLFPIPDRGPGIIGNALYR